MEQTLQERLLETYNWLCATRGVKKATVKLDQDEMLEVLVALKYARACKEASEALEKAGDR